MALGLIFNRAEACCLPFLELLNDLCAGVLLIFLRIVRGVCCLPVVAHHNHVSCRFQQLLDEFEVEASEVLALVDIEAVENLFEASDRLAARPLDYLAGELGDFIAIDRPRFGKVMTLHVGGRDIACRLPLIEMNLRYPRDVKAVLVRPDEMAQQECEPGGHCDGGGHMAVPLVCGL